MFDKIIGSKSMRKMMLNQFKKLIQEENIKHILISMDENGEAKLEQFKEPMIIMTAEKYNQIQQILKSNL